MQPYERTSATATVDQAATRPKVLLWTLWRSGTHWLADMLSELTGCPTVYASDDAGDYERETIDQVNHWQRGTILVRHVSLSPAELFQQIEPLGIRVVFLYRDPRDVLASSVNMRKYREGFRAGLPPFPDMSLSDILKWELESLHDHYTRLVPAWARADHPALLKIRYEDLLLDTATELQRLVPFLELNVARADVVRIIAKHSFTARTGRAPGSEEKTSHARKGVIGDHRTHFSAAEQETLNDLLGDALEQMGYER